MRDKLSKAVAVVTLCFCMSIPGFLGAQDPQYIYGLHWWEPGADQVMNGKKGWAVEIINADGVHGPGDLEADKQKLRSLIQSGFTPVIRINWGWYESIPRPDKISYDAYADRIAFVIDELYNRLGAGLKVEWFHLGNEYNLDYEYQPVGDGYGAPAQVYADYFNTAYAKVKGTVAGAGNVKVLVGPVANWAPNRPTDGFAGNPPIPSHGFYYDRYFRAVVEAIAVADGYAIHTYGGHGNVTLPHGLGTIDFGVDTNLDYYPGLDTGNTRGFNSFKVFMRIIKDHGDPTLPVLITETNTSAHMAIRRASTCQSPEACGPGDECRLIPPALTYTSGWFQQAYAKINDWNQTHAEKILALCWFVYSAQGEWAEFAIDDAASCNMVQARADFIQTTATTGYLSPGSGSAPPPPPPPPPGPPAGDNVALGAVGWLASSSYSSSFGGDKAYDGTVSASSKWTSDGSSAVSWLALDLGATYEVNGFIVRHAGAAEEPAYFNTSAYRLESGTSLNGPWTTLATVNNAAQANETTTTLSSPASTRFVRLYITDAGIDNYARIPELQVYGTPASSPPPPGGGNLVANGAFDSGLVGWSTWVERGTLSPGVSGGQLHMASADHNGGVYQQFSTGGAGAVISVDGFWATDPMVAQNQWAEVLIINGDRLPVNGQDVNGGQADVVVIYKNDTWTSPGGWSGSMEQTAPVVLQRTFTASAAVATVVLKSGNVGGATTGTRFDDIVVQVAEAPPPVNRPPTAVMSASPTEGPAPLMVAFDATGSTDPDGDALSFQWDFGDGAQATGASVSHTYSTAGTYGASLTADDGRGGTASSNGSITVNAPPAANNLVTNGDFSDGLNGWSLWTERGSLSATVSNGQLHVTGSNHNGGLYQQFETGGVGNVITVEGFWSSDPTVAQRQWAEILVINGPRLPVDGQDVHEGQSDVELIYKNDTWTSPGGWSGAMDQTAAVANRRTFTAAGAVATIILKSGNVEGVVTGTSFDDLLVEGVPTTPGNQSPTAVMDAAPMVGPAPLNVSFDAASSTDPDGDGLSFTWSFGDGSQGTGITSSHTYASPGTYVATLTVSDGRGGADEASVTISVGDGGPPMPDYCPATLDFAALRQQLHQQGQELVFSKIGFHVGPGGNQQGLGQWMECLDAAGVPFFLKSVDSAGQIYEAARLKEASGVPHVLVYRKSVVTSSDPDQNWNPDVPDYNKAPYDAAVEHWQRHRNAFPPELEPYKHLMWIETINEVDKNRAEWLAEFAYHTALMAMQDGFNWAAFAWSSGEPEPIHWEGPWMKKFLELAGNHPDRVAVALHEYSYETKSLDSGFPYLVGRFQTLFETCDRLGLPRPTVLVTEFGWAYQDIAPIGQAMTVDLPWADALYADYPQVKGAAIWYLGPGFGGISNQAQQLIGPLTGYALQTYFTIPLEPQP